MKLCMAMMAKPCNMLQPTWNNNICYLAAAELSIANQPISNLRIQNSFSSIGCINSKIDHFEEGGGKLRDKWMECQGFKNWEGMLDPLDDDLRCEILRYGEFVEAAYRSFDFDTSSTTYSTCRYTNDSMLARCGFGRSGYKVTRGLHATSSVNVPRWWIENIPGWIPTRSNWIGYVAVCDDEDEIARLGRRDVVIAYRGTVMGVEWLENLRATLTCLPDDMAPKSCEPMVQKGFLSLYTCRDENHLSLQVMVREEMSKIFQKYCDEPLSVTITGHSLGAALATLTAYDITNVFQQVVPLITVMSFGGPRVGNKTFRSQLEEKGIKVLRIVNSDDLVTKVPGFIENDDVVENGYEQITRLPIWMWKGVVDAQWVYAEVGKELRLSSKDCPQYLNKGDVATCHDLKTYLHLVDNFVSSSCPFRATPKRILNNIDK